MYRPAPNAYPIKWGKADLINRIAELRGYTRYLEICTAYTGFMYANIDRAILPTTRRLMYNCPKEFKDKRVIDYRSEDTNIAALVRQLKRDHKNFDIIFIDPWHEYGTTLRDLKLAMSLLAPGGTMMHDCLPPPEAKGYRSGPDYVYGDWWGVSYATFVDFVNTRKDIASFCVIDTDHGCGIIRKRSALETVQALLRNERPDPMREFALHHWRNLGRNYAALFAYLLQEAPLLHNKISVDDFLKREEDETRAAREARTPFLADLNRGEIAG